MRGEDGTRLRRLLFRTILYVAMAVAVFASTRHRRETRFAGDPKLNAVTAQVSMQQEVADRASGLRRGRAQEWARSALGYAVVIASAAFAAFAFHAYEAGSPGNPTFPRMELDSGAILDSPGTITVLSSSTTGVRELALSYHAPESNDQSAWIEINLFLNSPRGGRDYITLLSITGSRFTDFELLPPKYSDPPAELVQSVVSDSGQVHVLAVDVPKPCAEEAQSRQSCGGSQVVNLKARTVYPNLVRQNPRIAVRLPEIDSLTNNCIMDALRSGRLAVPLSQSALSHFATGCQLYSGDPRGNILATVDLNGAAYRFDLVEPGPESLISILGGPSWKGEGRLVSIDANIVLLNEEVTGQRLVFLSGVAAGLAASFLPVGLGAVLSSRSRGTREPQ